MDNQKRIELQKKAVQIRLGALEAVYSASSGHPGGSLSIAEILSYLYFEKIRHNLHIRFCQISQTMFP